MTEATEAPRRLRPLGSRLGIALIVALSVGYSAKAPPPPVPRSAPDTAFSAERAMDHVRQIAQAPHQMGTLEHGRVRGYLVAQFAALGLEPTVQQTTAVGVRFAEAGRVANVMARLRGTDSRGRAVLLAAHYDGVGAGPAASDDASGTSVVLEIMRALAAGPKPAHDVIALITDGEEVGLLGAAAFVKEHPWANDVEAVLNFEARGTGGQAVMFQTGPDNLDQIRLLRRTPDVTATSVAVTVYQFLPNDTDLSEFALLGKPGLNFAFADGVERYHTAQDDATHLDPGAIQQEGAQALAVTRALSAGPLPRPATGDAIFFDLPLVGLIYYPIGWARPIAVVAAALTLLAIVVVARRERRWWLGLGLGAIAMTLAVALAGGWGVLGGRGAVAALGGVGPRGWFAWGIGFGALGLTFALWAVVRRWAGTAAIGLGPAVVWTALAVAASWRLPGVSYVLVWPAVATSLALVARPGHVASAIGWLVALAVSLGTLVPLMHGMGLVALGPIGPGGIAMGGLTALVAWLMAAPVATIVGARPWRWAGGSLALGAALVLIARHRASIDTDYPIRSLIVYAEAADAPDGWLMAPREYASAGSWNRSALGADLKPVRPDSVGTMDDPPRWLGKIAGRRLDAVTTKTARVGLEPPNVTLLADTTTGAGRQVTLLVRPGASQFSVALRAHETQVREATVDGRLIDPSRYRYKTESWGLSYFAPPDSGFRLTLSVPAGAPVTLELVGQTNGLPEAIAARIPPRPAQVVTTQWGDFGAVYREVSFPATSQR